MINTIINQILNMTDMSSDINLSGFESDIKYFWIDNHDIFDSVDVITTDNPLSKINAKVIISEKAKSVYEISRELSKSWLDLEYNDFSATSLYVYQEATILRYVTVAIDMGLCVTGTIAATGPIHLKLVEKDSMRIQQFGLTREPLPCEYEWAL